MPKKTIRSSSRKATTKKTKVQQSDLILEHREVARKMARTMLKKWRAGLQIDELNSLVDLALCEAAAKYDSKVGASFTTFCFYYIRGHLLRTITTAKKNSNAAKIFSGDIETLAKENTEEDYTQLSSALYSYKLDRSETKLSGRSTPEAMFVKKENAELCKKAFEQLSPLGTKIIERAFFKDEQVTDIANSLGLSRHYVSRVKRKALKRLKNLINSYTYEAPFVHDENHRMHQLTREIRAAA